MHEISIYLISLTARLKSWWYYCYRGLESVSPSHACLDDKGQKQLKITELHLLCRSWSIPAWSGSWFWKVTRNEWQRQPHLEGPGGRGFQRWHALWLLLNITNWNVSNFFNKHCLKGLVLFKRVLSYISDQTLETIATTNNPSLPCER